MITKKNGSFEEQCNPHQQGEIIIATRVALEELITTQDSIPARVEMLALDEVKTWQSELVEQKIQEEQQRQQQLFIAALVARLESSVHRQQPIKSIYTFLCYLYRLIFKPALTKKVFENVKKQKTTKDALLVLGKGVNFNEKGIAIINDTVGELNEHLKTGVTFIRPVYTTPRLFGVSVRNCKKENCADFNFEQYAKDVGESLAAEVAMNMAWVM